MKIIENNKKFFKYICTSFTSFIFDYLMYSMFCLFIYNIIYCNIFARILSVLLNYYLARKYVFEYKKETRESLIKFYCVAGLKLLIGTIILNFLSNYINHYIAKVISELLTFFIAYFLANSFVFKQNKEQ